jgi:hypothetical protein
LLDDPERKLLVISPYGFDGDKPISEDETTDDEDKKNNKRTETIKDIYKSLKLDGVCDNQISYWFYGAKGFMNSKLKIENLAELFPEAEEDLIPEIEIIDEKQADLDSGISDTT